MTVKVSKAVSDSHFQSIVDEYLYDGWIILRVKDAGKDFEIDFQKK